MLVAAAEFGREKASNPAVRTSHTMIPHLIEAADTNARRGQISKLQEK